MVAMKGDAEDATAGGEEIWMAEVVGQAKLHKGQPYESGAMTIKTNTYFVPVQFYDLLKETCSGAVYTKWNGAGSREGGCTFHIPLTCFLSIRDLQVCKICNHTCVA